jgi:phosphatidylserine/phosphatidylglycerophosphate/cardiolipin synthase-like enzyme
LPLIAGSPVRPLLISAFVYDGVVSGDKDEAFQIYNPNAFPVDMSGWQLRSGARSAAFPALSIPPMERIWCGREALAFRRTFGALPACEWGADTLPEIPNLTGGALQLANTGGRISLIAPDSQERDVVVYKAGNVAEGGWRGPAIEPYKPTSAFSERGQVLYRKLDELSAMPVDDTDRAADWASDSTDPLLGRRVRYGGWRLEDFFFPAKAEEDASLQIVVAPDASFDALSQSLWAAQKSILYEGFTFESPALATILADRAQAGVSVRVLLEGAPPGGISDQQRWCVDRIAQAGGQVYYMVADSSAGVDDRYLSQHAKIWLLDDRTAIVSSENPSLDSFPNDEKADGTLGRRGVYLATDAPAVVQRIGAIIRADLDTAFADILPYDPAHPTLGAPPLDFVPVFDSGGIQYAAPFATPLEMAGRFRFEVCQAPEHSLRSSDCLLGLLGRAGAGDTVLVEQLQEPPYWGPGDGTVESDPNLRVEAYIAAARRGATVRVLLDAYFDDLSSARSNLRTQEYLMARARSESLDLEVRRANPAGLGLHNKMILAETAGAGWVMVGSLNGGEASAKLNREVSLLIGSSDAHRYLTRVFWSDWGEAAGQRDSFHAPQVGVE